MPRKNVLITGCGPNGIGGSLAKEFQLRGHRVFACGLSDSLLVGFRELGLDTVVMDVTSAASISEAVAHVRKLADGKLDILINNAGVYHCMPCTDTSIDDARRVFDVNVLGVLAVTQAFVPLLLEAGSNSIVANLGSINTIVRPPFMAMYNASKAALDALSATMRTELAPLGIRVVIVKTGSVRSDLFNNSPPQRLPEHSLYMPLKKQIEERKMLEGSHYIDAGLYAQRVVSELLRPSVKRVIWQGGLTTIAWLMSYFMPDGLMVRPTGTLLLSWGVY